MSRLNRILPIVGGAVAGGAIALAVAAGSTTTHSVTTTVVQPAGLIVHPHLVQQRQPRPQREPDLPPGQPWSGRHHRHLQSRGGGLNPFGGGSQQAQGEGAGVVYDKNGHILTDEHVVAGATSVKVKFQDGYTASAKVLGTDPSTDVGVIQVNAPASELHPIPFADSSAATVGDPVVAIGSPFSLPETTTTGIVSAVGRSITAPNNYTITGAIQTDAAINPGNSGGPLLDASGHVLGLNDQIQTQSGSSAGVGFAVPSNTVARIANTIIAGHAVKHSYVGVELNASSSPGAQVTKVQPNSPALSAGLQQGDVVTAINGKAISSTSQFIQTVDSYPPGTKLTLTVKRGGSTQQIQLTLGNRPKTPNGG